MVGETRTRLSFVRWPIGCPRALRGCLWPGVSISDRSAWGLVSSAYRGGHPIVALPQKRGGGTRNVPVWLAWLGMTSIVL